jgi:hypothetical protein
MSLASAGFAAWACDPQRTLEERFGAELLIEITRGLWCQKHGVKHEVNYQAEQLRKKERSLDPTHEPRYTGEAAAQAEEVLPGLKQLNFGWCDDRPLRDLSFLRFCPPLNSLELRNTEIRDWSPLLCQTSLTIFHLWSDLVARDLRVLGRLAKLQDIHMFLGAPWPDLTGLENLAELREFNFHGNILALQGIPCLPNVRVADIEHGYGYNLPLRNLADLPAMPELRRLKLINTAEFDGIQRFTKLLNLEIYGYFTDLAPLARLKDLTHLILSGGDYPTLAPLATLPQLRRLIVRLEIPPDFTPLADAPRLHEIGTEATHIVPPELASLNAMFNPWSEEFAAAVPRPLAPLKLFLRDPNSNVRGDNGGVPRDWGDDKEMDQSEARWFAREINRRLTALLGPGWGQVEEYGLIAGYEQVAIGRPQDFDHVPAVVQCLRELIASARHPWEFLFMVDSDKWYERNMEDIYSDEGEEFDAERQREEWEDERRQERERREFLERKYRHRLQQELGTPAAPLPPAPPPAAATDEEDTIAAGQDEPPAPPEYDLGTSISLYCTLTEKAVYVHAANRALAEMLLEIKAEN